MKTYYTVFSHWYGHEALLKICDTMEEAKAAVHEVAIGKKKSNDECEPDYDMYYITAKTI